MSIVLAAECVSKTFGTRRILSSASLHAISGQMLALVGRNGAGKSTLLRIAAGWIQPDGGAVHVNGRAYLSVSLPMLAREGVFLLPDHDLLSSAFTVRAQLEMFRHRYGQGDPEAAAALMGITHALDRHPHTLSGGELRRAEVAVALVRNPACFLADEPYRGIAPVDMDVLTGAFRELANRGCAVVFTGHEIETVLAAADRVTWCVSGTTRELGTPQAAANDHAFQHEYLGPRIGARMM